MQIACGVNGGIDAPSTVVVNKLSDDIERVTRDCESGLRTLVWATSYISGRRRDARRRGTRERTFESDMATCSRAKPYSVHYILRWWSLVIFTWSTQGDQPEYGPMRPSTGICNDGSGSYPASVVHVVDSDTSRYFWLFSFPFRAVREYTIRGTPATGGQRFSRPSGFSRLFQVSVELRFGYLYREVYSVPAREGIALNFARRNAEMSVRDGLSPPPGRPGVYGL